MDESIKALLRSDLIECIDEFIDTVQPYNSKVTTIVKAKKMTDGFLCIITVKKVIRDTEKTITKSAMKVQRHEDLNFLQAFFKCQCEFVKECYSRIPCN